MSAFQEKGGAKVENIESEVNVRIEDVGNIRIEEEKNVRIEEEMNGRIEEKLKGRLRRRVRRWANAIRRGTKGKSDFKSIKPFE